MKHESAGTRLWIGYWVRSEQHLWGEERTFQTTPKSKSMITLGIYVKGTKKLVKPVQQGAKMPG